MFSPLQERLLDSHILRVCDCILPQDSEQMPQEDHLHVMSDARVHLDISHVGVEWDVSFETPSAYVLVVLQFVHHTHIGQEEQRNTVSVGGISEG